MLAGITLGSVYTFCFILGLGFAVLSAIFSTFACGHSGPHIGEAIPHLHIHADAHLGHAHIGHEPDGNMSNHADIRAVDSHGQAEIAPISTLTISVFATSFGGFGLLWQRAFGENMAGIGAVSGVAFGLIIAALTFYVFAMIFRETQGSSIVRPAELVGLEGELMVGITTENPIGQISFVVCGRKQVGMARSSDGKPIEKNRRVTIVRVEKSDIYVKE